VDPLEFKCHHNSKIVYVFETCGDYKCDGLGQFGGWIDLLYYVLHEIQDLQLFNHTSTLGGQNACTIVLWVSYFSLLLHYLWMGNDKIHYENA
jgi:hypothetical protein